MRVYVRCFCPADFLHEFMFEVFSPDTMNIMPIPVFLWIRNALLCQYVSFWLLLGITVVHIIVKCNCFSSNNIVKELDLFSHKTCVPK